MHAEILEKIHIGTSGWSYADWVGPFYPEGTPTAQFLGAYAQHFAAVEVDATFYFVPSRHTVESWARNTPDGFRFALKVPGLITHGARGERYRVDKVLMDEDRSLDAFLESAEALGEKLAVVLFQFPYFRVKDMSADQFQERLAHTLERLPSSPRFAVEVRNKGWLTPPFLALLESFRVAAVMIDHPYLPLPFDQLRLGMVTSDLVYVRLLGDRYAIEKKTKTWDRVIENRSRRLEAWADVVAEIAARRDVGALFAFANNHFAGHAPETSRELLELIASRGVDQT